VIVLDTNVVSELMRAAPSPEVVRWVATHPSASLYTTALTEAEILHGARLLPPGKRRNGIELAAGAMFDQDFAGRVLPFERDAARSSARIAADRRRAGRPISQFDAQIAGIVAAVGGVLATRNTADFEACGIELVDPWVEGVAR
jgi:predicted nucleic acid-binding protein